MDYKICFIRPGKVHEKVVRRLADKEGNRNENVYKVVRQGKILPKIFQGLSGFLGTRYAGVRRLGIWYLPEYSHKNRCFRVMIMHTTFS